jgi:hypothetical protein
MFVPLIAFSHASSFSFDSFPFTQWLFDKNGWDSCSRQALCNSSQCVRKRFPCMPCHWPLRWSRTHPQVWNQYEETELPWACIGYWIHQVQLESYMGIWKKWQRNDVRLSELLFKWFKNRIANN